MALRDSLPVPGISSNGDKSAVQLCDRFVSLRAGKKIKEKNIKSIAIKTFSDLL
jgi:ABC-type Na+ transport system ATPase subunit NatA